MPAISIPPPEPKRLPYVVYCVHCGYEQTARLSAPGLLWCPVCKLWMNFTQQKPPKGRK
jgi:hypothetical protein